MFDLKKPCSNCPFRIGQGELYRLHEERLLEILEGDSWFQCHQTVEYDEDGEGIPGAGGAQHCYGAAVIRMNEGHPNQLMQVAGRIGAIDLDTITSDDVYSCIDDVLEVHAGRP